MATRTRFFRTDSTTGGDGTVNTTSGANRAYPTLFDAEAAEQADLVAAGDILHLICTITGNDGSAGIVDFDGWTTGASDFILIECQGVARNDGVSFEKNSLGYQLTRAGDCLRITEDFVRVLGLEIGTTGGSFSPIEVNNGGPPSDIRIDDCYLMSTNTTIGSTTILDVNNTNATVSVTNTLVIANGKRGIDARLGTVTIDHCGFSCGGTLSILADDSTTITNTWAIGGTDEDFWTGGTAPSGSHNASEDASVTTDYSDSIASITPANEFTNPTAIPSTADFTLLDSLLNAAGTGSLADDIADTTRTGTADIGVFEFAAAAADFLPASYSETIVRY